MRKLELLLAIQDINPSGVEIQAKEQIQVALSE